MMAEKVVHRTAESGGIRMLLSIEAELRGTPGWVAANDVISWQIHSQAQEIFEQRGGPTDEYYELYGDFVDRRVPVEQRIFNIPEEVARVTATWLARAAQYHDCAEYGDQSDGSDAAFRMWESAKDCLVYRYIVANIFMHTERKDCEEILSSISSFQDVESLCRFVMESGIDFGFEVPRDQQSPIVLKQVGDDGFRAKKLIPITAEGLVEKSYREADLELKQWQYHHMERYSEFIDVTEDLYLSLGLGPYDSKAASAFLSEACIRHDNAEGFLTQVRELPSKVEDGRMVESELPRYREVLLEQAKNSWLSALDILVKYYEIIMRPRYFELD